MAVRESTPRRGDRRHVWLAAAVLGLLAAWAVISAARRPEPSPASHPAREAAPTRALATPLVDAPAPPTPARAPELAADGVPIKPSDPAAPVPSGPVRPHPITPAHERIYRENTLLGALNGAMDVKDAPGLRRLLAEYRDEYPEDEHALQRGYEIIADCLDHPGDASTSAAHRYYDTETASTLRRYVRRYCFELAPEAHRRVRWSWCGFPQDGRQVRRATRALCESACELASHGAEESRRPADLAPA